MEGKYIDVHAMGNYILGKLSVWSNNNWLSFENQIPTNLPLLMSECENLLRYLLIRTFVPIDVRKTKKKSLLDLWPADDLFMMPILPEGY